MRAPKVNPVRKAGWRQLSRRTVLRLAAGVPVLAALPVPGAGRARAAAAGTDAAERVAGLFAHRDAAARLGMAYLRLFPDEADPARLTEAIAARGPDLGTALCGAPGADDHLRQCLAAQRRRDFIAGETVQVERWILSRTEARLCALMALTPAPVPPLS